MNILNNEFNYYPSNQFKQYNKYNTNNILQNSFEQKNVYNDNFKNYELRKIIKEEFESHIIPYRNEINQLKEEINNIYNSFNKNSIESLIKDIKISLYNFVDKKIFYQKLEEMDSKIDNNSNNFNQSKFNLINNIVKEIKKVNLEINNIRNNNNLMKLNFSQNKIEKEPIDNNNLNEIKLKDITDKTSFLKTDFENLKEEIDSFKKITTSSILENNKNLNKLEFDFENLKNDNSSNKLNYLQDISKIKEDIKKIRIDINDMKIINEDTSMKNFNNNNEIKIYEILEKLNLTRLSKFDLDKYNMIYESYEKLMKNFINLTKIIENQNNNMSKLNNKLNEVSFLASKQSKKEIINYPEDNNLFQKKIDILERQIQYLQDRIEKISLETIHIKDSNNLYENNKEDKLIMKQEITKLSNQIAVYNTLIEENNKKREEINLRIDELKKEIKEEKNVGLENKMSNLQNQNNIKTNQQKVIEFEDKYKKLEETIIILNEEKIKKLETEIARIDEKWNSYVRGN